MIRVEHVSKEFSGDNGVLHAVRDVSFEVKEGEIFGIIGFSGAGKSTLVQHLNGLLKPTSGQVLVDGEDMNGENVDRRRIRQKVGLVFQYPEYQLFEETIAKDIAFGPKNQGLSEEEIDQRVRRAMACAFGLRQIRRAQPVRPLRRTDAPRGDCGRAGDGAEGADSGRTRCRA